MIRLKWLAAVLGFDGVDRRAYRGTGQTSMPPPSSSSPSSLPACRVISYVHNYGPGRSPAPMLLRRPTSSAANRAPPPIAARTAAGIRVLRCVPGARRHLRHNAGLTRISIIFKRLFR